jgi:hypothetical protein
MMEELKKLLSCHDWYYQYSDDFRKWTWGRDNENQIRSYLNELNHSNEAKALYNEYAPDKYKFEL